MSRFSFSSSVVLIKRDRWKESGEQYDDRVVEVAWDKPRLTWKLLRFRDDKREGNFKDVVTSIVHSIKDGVEAMVVSRISFLHDDGY